jgi:hypothetical protein
MEAKLAEAVLAVSCVMPKAKLTRQIYDQL